MKILNMNIPPIPYIDMAVGTGGGARGQLPPKYLANPKNLRV